MWLYLAITLDLYHRKVFVWATIRTKAFSMPAMCFRPYGKPLVFSAV